MYVINSRLWVTLDIAVYETLKFFNRKRGTADFCIEIFRYYIEFRCTAAAVSIKMAFDTERDISCVDIEQDAVNGLKAKRRVMYINDFNKRVSV